MDLLSLAFRLLKTIDGWLWVVAILGLARSRVARSQERATRRSPAGRPDRVTLARRLGAYGNEAVLPFYVLHETVIVVIADYVLPWRIGAGAQYLLIVASSLAATLLLYDLGIRRTPITRFLFGLPPDRRPHPGGPGTRRSPSPRAPRRLPLRLPVTPASRPEHDAGATG